MKRFLFIFFLLFFSCSIGSFNVKKESNFFNIKFYIFVTKDEDIFKGKGEGFLSEEEFFCSINDLLLNKKVVSMLFDKDGLKAYVYTEEVGYLVNSSSIGEFFSKDFFYLFKSGEMSLRKNFTEDKKDYNLKAEVNKTQNGFPKRISFEISSSEEKVNIVIDIFELSDKSYNFKFDIDISEFYKYNIFDFFRSIQ